MGWLSQKRSIPGPHAHLRQDPGRALLPQAHHHLEAQAGEAQGGQGPTEATPARAHTSAGSMAGQRGARPRCLLRRAGQHQRGIVVPHPGDTDLVPGASATKPANPRQLEPDGPTRYPMGAARPRDAPLPGGTLRRQTPEAGAQCGSPARWDLCWGPPVRAVPTAIETHDTLWPTVYHDFRTWNRDGTLTRVASGSC